MDYEQLFAEVPRYGDALLAAWSDDLAQFDQDVYKHALVAMGRDGQTGFVLIAWARMIACAYALNEEPFQGFRDNGDIELHVLDHGARLVETARTADINRLVPLMRDISSELGDADIQPLIFAMAWNVKQLLSVAGGRQHYAELVALVRPCAERVDAKITVEPIAYALAVISHGHLERGREALRALLNVAQLEQVLTALVAVAAVIMPNPGRIVMIDEYGIPDSVSVPGSKGKQPNTLLLALATDAIRAVNALQFDRVRELAAEIGDHPEHERAELLWQLAVSLGYKLASVRQQRS